jgi:DNA repair protein RecO (recombination protein O)
MLQTRGIVFRTVKYGETSIIADIYTEEKGLQSFIGGNVRSARSAMPYSMFQPMQVIELVSYFKDSGKSLHRLKEVRLAQHFERIPFDVRRGAITLFMAEVLRKCIREEQEDPAFFAFLVDTLTLLDAPDCPLPLMPAWLLAQLTDWLGIRPSGELEPDGETVFFDLREGATTHTPSPFSEQMDTVTTQYLFQMLEATDLHQLQIPAAARKTLLDGLLKYYAFHVDKFNQVNAHEVLNTVFHG